MNTNDKKTLFKRTFLLFLVFLVSSLKMGTGKALSERTELIIVYDFMTIEIRMKNKINFLNKC